MFVLPIYRGDEAPERPSWGVTTLIVLNTLFLILTYLFGPPESVYKTYGFTPNHPTVLTLFTSMFLHGGLWHLLGNMWFLWMFGVRVEKSLGTWMFLLVYLLCGLGGGALHYVFNLGSTIPCIGASGAISGIAGCFFVLFPKADFDLLIYIGWIRLKTIPSHTTMAVGAWIGEQTLLGLLSQAVRFSSTAFWGHVGGFAVGTAAAILFKEFVPLNIEGVPIVRPWFVPQDAASEERETITQLKL